MRRVGLFIGLTLALLLAGGAPPSRWGGAGRAAAAGEFKLARLYSHVSARGYRLYKPGATLPPGLSDSPWKNEGPLCIVASEHAPGLKPIYQLAKADEGGVRFNYVVSKRAPEEAGGWLTEMERWTDQGPAFYVAMTQLPGTVPLYKLHKSPGIIAVGPMKGQLMPGSDSVILTVDPAVREKMMASTHRTTERVLGYVWTKPPEPGPLPDLTVRQASVEGDTIRAEVANQGKVSVSSKPGVAVQLVLLDRDGKQTYTTARPAGGMSPGQSSQVVFEVGGQTLVGRRYFVRVDHMNQVKESDEKNNATAPAPVLTVKVNPPPGGHVRPPSIRLVAVQPAPTQDLPKRTLYRLSVTNADAFKLEWFTPTQKLPTTPCGTHTDARVLARLHVVRNGQALNAGCKPLRSAADLSSLDINSTVPLGDADTLRVTLEDRQAAQRYESQPYAVGWFGLDKVLAPSGCKYFLGRAGSFLCATDAGVAACEALRQEGKPVQCTRAGKPQD